MCVCVCVCVCVRMHLCHFLIYHETFVHLTFNRYQLWYTIYIHVHIYPNSYELTITFMGIIFII